MITLCPNVYYHRVHYGGVLEYISKKGPCHGTKQDLGWELSYSKGKIFLVCITKFSPFVPVILFIGMAGWPLVL